eukprot:scaffold656105_cov29-Prasinocladus_malaysianus.AAC.1
MILSRLVKAAATTAAVTRSQIVRMQANDVLFTNFMASYHCYFADGTLAVGINARRYAPRPASPATVARRRLKGPLM